jgi:flavin-binding protein dodecin
MHCRFFITPKNTLTMATSIYKVIEVIGTSEVSWEDAAKQAVERASKTLEDLRIAEVVSQDMKVENGKIKAYRTKLSLSFKFREE